MGLDWRRFELPVPDAEEFDTDGTATLSWNSGYVLDATAAGPEIGTSGRRLRADVLIDAQARSILLAINDVWRDAMSQFGIQIYDLGSGGDEVRDQATFLAGSFQEDELIAFLASVPEGGVVALGMRGLGPGAAAERVGPRRAHVLVGKSGHRKPISLRRIRLRPSRLRGGSP